MSEPSLKPFGEIIPRTDLRIQKACEFADYLCSVGPDVFAQFHETRRLNGASAEAVVFSVNVERPQKPVYDIRRKEWFEAVFCSDDQAAPEVLSLRADFPNTPHLNLRSTEFPRALCLYDQAYENVRLTWTPAHFLQRVRYWLARTATGTLHGEDQPLEPLIISTGNYLVVPPDFEATDICGRPRLLDVFLRSAINSKHVFIARWQGSHSDGQPHHIAAAFCCRPQLHGVIRRQPEQLQHLQELCLVAGLDLVSELTKTIQQWHRETQTPQLLQAKLLILLQLPKLRHYGEKIHSVETRAFLTAKTVEEVGTSLGAMQKHGGKSAYSLNISAPSQDVIAAIPVAPLEVVSALSRESAAKYNGLSPVVGEMVVIGLGALGSQVLNHLVRSGFGRWTLIDDDILLPHNCARHVLGGWAVGDNKAEGMSKMANAILDGSPVAHAIAANLLKPKEHSAAVEKALGTAQTILDMSASVAVARDLAFREDKARAICAFLTPKGDGLVVAAEDSRRRVRLDWLEMLHYRAVLNEPALNSSLLPHDARFRYGNSCRDVSAQLAQDDAGIWSGVASKAIKTLHGQEEAALRIHIMGADGSTQVFQPQITVPDRITLGDWTIVLDHWVLEKLVALREQRLPNETGGILIGGFDTQHRVCTLIDILPSPPDSKEWPMSYIRGCEGLPQQVKEIGKKTLDQVGYVGEWHSHPDGASTEPSGDDRQAYAWLCGYMNIEALPAIMLIIAQGKRFALVSTTA